MNNLTDQEIRTLWKNKDLTPRQMVLCLSELEGCEYQDMRDHLERLGLIKDGEFKSYRRPYTNRGNLNGRPYSCAEIREVFRMLNKGKAYKEIAYALGRSYASIHNCVIRYGDRYGRSQ